MRAGIEDMPGRVVRDPDQRIVSRAQGVVAVIGATGKPIELRPRDAEVEPRLRGAATFLIFGRQALFTLPVVV